MTDILAIVSKAVFERDAKVRGETARIGDVWAVDRYVSTTKIFQTLGESGRIFLVTVRPPDERLWLVGVLDRLEFDGTAWVAAAPNTTPVIDVSALRSAIRFASGKGMSQDKGALGMSLQTPRALAPADVALLVRAAKGKVLALPAPPAPAAALAGTLHSASEEPLHARRVLAGRYEILRPLGEGGMGVVHEARHVTTGRRVALKEITGDGDEARSEALLERFEREARAMGEIESAHVAHVLDSGTDAATGNPFLVMELLRGEDLQTLLRRVGPLPEEVALRVCAQAARGLAAAHAVGVVHRDVKPANLFLARAEDGAIVVKVVDFGVARMREELVAPGSLTLTSTGIMLGTPLYMSPEQVQGPKHVDHRTDVWSLGVVLYEMLVGATPWSDAETLGALLVAICARPARPLAEAAPWVSPPTAALVARALAPDPKARTASAAALFAELSAALPRGSSLEEADFSWRPESIRANLASFATAETAAAPAPIAGTLASATDDPRET